MIHSLRWLLSPLVSMLLGSTVLGQVAQPRLVVQPAALDLAAPGSRHGLLVSALGSDGAVQEIRPAPVFTSRAPQVVAVDARGECTALRVGQTEIVVQVGSQSIVVPVKVKAEKSTASPSFLNEVVPLFTRLGCNQGACHGKNAGQNGFRLSLRGYAPEWDHEGLTREFQGRRISLAQPEESIVLLKGQGLAPHEGGKLFSQGSREYLTLLNWIKAGARPVQKGEHEAKRLEVLPGNRVLRPGQEQQLLVRADWGDGNWEDVTWLSRFDSNDPGMAAVDAHGKIRVLRHGETAIRVSFQTQVAVLLISAPYNQPIKPEAFSPKNNFIDEHVFAKLAALHIEPSGLCSDGEFIRRAFLDTIGVLPTADEVRAFLNDSRPDKRARLVDSLLARPEFVDLWTLFIADLVQNRKERDHDVRGVEGVKAFHGWIKEQVKANRPWDQIARAVLTATGNSKDHPTIGYYIVTVGEHREAHRSEVVASVAQTFLGTRIGCAQCHNHPLERYTQDDYYHFAAYFSRIHFKRQEPKKGPTTLSVAGPDGKLSKNPIGVTQPRTGQFMAAQPLDRVASTIPPTDDPRIHLAEWITSPKNAYFSGAMVNRIWKHYLGVGLVEPVDDLRASNPPTNPELWEALNREFVAHQFDLRHLMRVILNSRTYQLRSSTLPTNARDQRFYSHYHARRLPAEVLLDALSQSTGVPESFPEYPKGTRACQLPDPGMKSYFLSAFGRSDRVTACACERSGEVTLPQLLHLQNGESVVRKIGAGDGRLAALLKAKKTDAAIVEELFLTTLARRPTPAEQETITKTLAESDRPEALRDLFWALLNSKEFTFNH